MLHPFRNNVFKILQVSLTFCLFLVACLISNQVASAAEDMNQIVSVTSKVLGPQTEIRLKGVQPFVSSVYQLPKPERVIVDVADAVLAENFILPPNIPYRVGMTKVPGTKPVITRFEFFVPGLVSFSSKQEGPETLLVINTKEAPSVKSNGGEAVVGKGEVKDQVSTIIGQQRSIESQLPDIKPLERKNSPQVREQQMQDAFNFSGYNKERISVEFQKMDLHNVFNFLRQVSGVNIVVDESVQGSLTLVLDDVPWDFALDVILNLKGLEKEDRFNTLVIYPKGKGFIWPEQAENNLSFKADSAVIQKEALVVQQLEKQPEGILEAKEFIAKGIKAEQREDYETAVLQYERGLDKWPKNVSLANKISALYLVRLQQNAKALYFAQRALKVDSTNQAALLNAGVACANMQDPSQADHYFSRCVQAKRPMQEALLNYAALKEERKSYNGALSLLNRHDQLYGKNLDSMIASARVTDKMGNTYQADTLYRAILNSGFRVPPDLAKYIQGRVSSHSNL